MNNKTIVKNLINLEKKYLKYFFKSDFNFREMITMRIFNELIKKDTIFSKKVSNLNILEKYIYMKKKQS